MKSLVFAVSLVFSILSAVPAGAADPVVSGVVMSQRTDGSRLVDVTYDLADVDGDTCAVTLLLSDDGGASWNFPVVNATGDVGKGVIPGPGRAIIWDAGSFPDLPVIENLRARVVASDLGVTYEPHSPRLVVITDFSHVDWSDPGNLEIYSRADLLQLMGSTLWTGGDFGDQPIIAQLKARNPALKVVAYISAKTAKLAGASPNADPFWQDWYTATLPYWVYTTAGDTASDFPGNVIVNTLDPACRQAMIETVVEYQTTSLNIFDGVYWDYFNVGLWVHPDVEAEGEPDMDGDGIAHLDDPDERIGFRASHISLITALRDSLGEGFIQIFNGQRAYGDSTFAALGDGMMYELFPTLYFPDPDMQHALDPAYANNLFRARGWPRTGNGGPYLILGNTMNNVYLDQEYVLTPVVNGNVFRAAALMADVHVTWHRDDLGTFSNTYSWTDNDITLGQPLGPPTFEGDFIRRDFEYGNVEIEMKSGAYPNPYAYRIWNFGLLVEALDIPFRVPPYDPSR